MSSCTNCHGTDVNHTSNSCLKTKPMNTPEPISKQLPNGGNPASRKPLNKKQVVMLRLRAKQRAELEATLNKENKQ